MNEMKLLEEFRAAVAPPDQCRLAEARARVLAGAKPSGLSRWRAPGRQRPAAWRWLAPAGAAAAVTAVAVTAAVVIPPGSQHAPGRPAVPLTAATVLHRAALAALAAPVPGNKQFIYAYMVTTAPISGKQVDQMKAWEWVSVTGTRPGVSEWRGCSSSGICGSFALSKGLIPVQKDPFVFTYASLQKLPTAPGALLDYLYQEQARACPRLGKLGIPVTRALLEFWGIETILTDVPVLPPRFGAALFDAAAHIPGIAVIKNVRAATGQLGIAVAMTPHVPLPPAGPGRLEFVFSARTYRFIGTNTLAGGGPETGLVASRFVGTAPVGGLGAGGGGHPSRHSAALRGVGVENPPRYWQSCPAFPAP